MGSSAISHWAERSRNSAIGCSCEVSPRWALIFSERFLLQLLHGFYVWWRSSSSALETLHALDEFVCSFEYGRTDGRSGRHAFENAICALLVLRSVPWASS